MEVDYQTNKEGLVESVTFDGKRHELSDSEQRIVPGARLPEARSQRVNVNSTVEDLKESWMKDAHKGESILADIEATHGGYFNNNMYFYLADGMEEMVDTWVDNGGRPYVVNHNLDRGDPKGRVVGAKFVDTGPDTGFHALDVRIGDPDEIEMVIDGRALHVSVGSRPVDTVECRVCGHDLFHDGKSPVRYRLEGEPDNDMLNRTAPGFFGEALDMTNEEFWNITETDDGTYTALCRHIRGFEAPMGESETLKTGWYCHGQKYREVSRVNKPADINDETGEFAHIRGVKEKEMEDSAREKLVNEEMSSTPDQSVVNRSRCNIASEKDLFRPRTPQRAQDFAKETGYQAMFDSGLWKATHAKHSEKSMADQVKLYWKEGGRFIDRASATNSLSPKNTNSRNRIETATNMTDAHSDAKYSQGDKVKWSWQGSTVHGRVAASGESFTIDGNEITGEEGEPVYKLDEYDQDAEEFKDGNVAKPESSLSKSDMDMGDSRDATTTTDAEYEVEEETIDITPPDYMVDAAQAYLDASDENIVPDSCGSGTGSERASQIVNDEVGPEVIDEVAAYLTSHEEDLTADGNPSGWGEEEWEDCGNAQYAAWGGGGSGDAKSWAQDKADEVAEAKGEEIPYGDSLSLHEALKLEDAREFGQWLRDSDYEGEEADMIDDMYTRRYLRRMQDEDGDWESAGSKDLSTTGSMDGEWDGSDALDQMMSAAEGEDGEIDESMVKRGVAAFDSSSDGQNKSDYKGPFAVVEDGEMKADLAGIDSLNKMAEQMDVPDSVAEDAKSLAESYMPEEEKEESEE